MVTRLAKVGNSVSARLPKTVLDELRLSAGDEVQVLIHKRAIVLKPVRSKSKRKRLSLRELLKGMRPDGKGVEVGWGRRADREQV